MNLVTLTSDFGTSDGYAASLKGVIYSAYDSVHVIDLIHDIEPFDIVQAALFLKQAIRHFPNKTVHIIGVDALYTSDAHLLILETQQQLLIGPDNGILSLVSDPKEILTIYRHRKPYTDLESFLQRVKELIGHLLSEKSLKDLAVPFEDYQKRIDLKPTIGPNQIRASVIHIDRFENVILNVDAQLLKEIGHDRALKIFYRRNDPITQVAQSYGDVEVGEVTCVINSYDLMEIGINKGKAHSMLGLNKDDTVIIEFEPNSL
ncbi:MAG: SAM-dependent chlorinase/fluorinase [Bacteroidia bacterium]|nr:SAM-dependent chlorinase/fluorinase [Bacteroidia bacterium]